MRYEIWFGKHGHHVTETVEQGNRVSSLQESRRPYTMLKENHKETEYFEFKIYPLYLLRAMSSSKTQKQISYRTTHYDD